MSDHGVLATLHGVSIGSIITGAGVWTAVATLVGIVLRSRVPMRKMKIEADEQLLATTIERLTKVEAALESQRVSYETRIEAERAQHAADLAVMRHRTNNLDQCLTMLLMLIEQDPDKAREAAAKVRAMREKQELAEAAEKGAQAGAKIAAATPAT